MKISYDPEVDVLRILLNGRPIEESDEPQPGLILDYDADGNSWASKCWKNRGAWRTPGPLSTR